jgi:hypothetical protein
MQFANPVTHLCRCIRPPLQARRGRDCRPAIARGCAAHKEPRWAGRRPDSAHPQVLVVDRESSALRVGLRYARFKSHPRHTPPVAFMASLTSPVHGYLEFASDRRSSQESSQDSPQHGMDLAVSSGPKTAGQRTAQDHVDDPDRVDAEGVRGSNPLPPTKNRRSDGCQGCTRG